MYNCQTHRVFHTSHVYVQRFLFPMPVFRATTTMIFAMVSGTIVGVTMGVMLVAMAVFLSSLPTVSTAARGRGAGHRTRSFSTMSILFFSVFVARLSFLFLLCPVPFLMIGFGFNKRGVCRGSGRSGIKKHSVCSLDIYHAFVTRHQLHSARETIRRSCRQYAMHDVPNTIQPRNAHRLYHYCFCSCILGITQPHFVPILHHVHDVCTEIQ